MTSVSDPAEALPVEDGVIWYVSYGSNMCSARLAAYLSGGLPPGGSRQNPGARDGSPPRRSVPVDLPGSLYFAGHSPQWGGGVAFYDHDDTAGGPTAGRAYLLTAQQLTDVAAQEMYRVPQDGDPLEEVVLGGLEGGRHRAGPGRYETLVEVGRLDGAPMLLFTAPHGRGSVEHTAPAPAYLAMLEVGLRECGWDDTRVRAYVARVTAQPSGA